MKNVKWSGEGSETFEHDACGIVRFYFFPQPFVMKKLTLAASAASLLIGASLAMPAFAASSAPMKYDPTCESAAVQAQGTAISAAIATYNQAWTSAFNTLISGRVAATAMTDKTARNQAYATAKKTYRAAVAAAKKAYVQAAKTADQAFVTASKACKVTPSTSDQTTNTTM